MLSRVSINARDAVSSGGGGDTRHDDAGGVGGGGSSSLGGSGEQTEFAFRLHLYKAKILLLKQQVRAWRGSGLGNYVGKREGFGDGCDRAGCVLECEGYLLCGTSHGSCCDASGCSRRKSLLPYCSFSTGPSTLSEKGLVLEREFQTTRTRWHVVWERIRARESLELRFLARRRDIGR